MLDSHEFSRFSTTFDVYKKTPNNSSAQWHVPRCFIFAKFFAKKNCTNFVRNNIDSTSFFPHCTTPESGLTKGYLCVHVFSNRNGLVWCLSQALMTHPLTKE